MLSSVQGRKAWKQMDRQPKDTRIRWNKGSSSEIKLSNKFGSADLPQNLPARDGLFVEVIELMVFFVPFQPRPDT